MKRINILSIQQVKERSTLYEFNRITSPQVAANIINHVFSLSTKAQEFLGILCLNAKLDVTGAHIISQGTLDEALGHPREIFKAAMLNNAQSIILFHNHPSGDPNPSNEDVGLTNRMRKAGDIIGINVLDHIIIGDDNGYASLKELGLWGEQTK